MSFPAHPSGFLLVYGVLCLLHNKGKRERGERALKLTCSDVTNFHNECTNEKFFQFCSMLPVTRGNPYGSLEVLASLLIQVHGGLVIGACLL